MIRAADVAVVRIESGCDVLLVRVAAGDALTRPAAQRVVNALRAAIPVSQLALDVVVLSGDQGPLFGSSEAVETLCRRDLAHRRASYHWTRKILDW